MSTITKRKAAVNRDICVACGACVKVCPKNAVSVWRGCFAKVDTEICVGCGMCAKICPAGCITVLTGGAGNE